MKALKTNHDTPTYSKLIKAMRAMMLQADRFEDIRITNVSEEAHVAQGSFYNHFGTLDAARPAVISREEAECWKKMLQYYNRIPIGTFSQKVQRLAVNLTVYINTSSSFRKIVCENAPWYGYFTDTELSGSESMQFHQDLKEYAKSAGISQDQAMMNVHMLLTNTARYANKALGKKIPLTLKETQTDVRKTASHLFPEQ